MKIEDISIEKLTMYDKNAKKHEEKDISIIKESIEKFGFNDPVGVWGENNTIVEGHGRVLAAKELGIKTIPCIRLDYLSDEERRGYALAHNKTAEFSQWDFNILDAEIAELNNIDFEKLGFEVEKIDADDFTTDFKISDNEKSEYCQMTISLHNEQKKLIENVIKMINNDEITETFGNENKNGNAIYKVVKEWAEQKKLL